MSKVKTYIDTKQKARHRQRRCETAHKKNTRIRNSKLGVYYYWGYYHEDERYTFRYEKTDSQERVTKKIAEEKVIPVSIVKRISRNAKDLKKHAARKLRRHLLEEDSPAIKGSTYKKDFDIPWTLL